MNSKKNANIIIAVILLFTLAAELIYYPKMPDIIPIHWGSDGQIDGWGPKYMMFIFWGIALGINFLMLFAEKIDPRVENYARFAKVFNIFRVSITALLCGIVMLTLAFSFDPQFADMNGIMYLIIGPMFVMLGNYMPKVKHNYTFGIKTPWTFASENVWNKTHRMAGPLWVAGGLAMMAIMFVKNSNLATVLMLAVIIAMVIIPTVYSYFEFQREKENLNNEKDD